MKKTVTVVCVVLLICLTALVGLLTQMKREFTHQVYHGADAVAFILRHTTLSKQWQDCGLSTNAASVLRVTAAQGVLQSGSRFCVAARVESAQWAGLWQQLSVTNETELRDAALNLCVTGKQFTISPRVGYDGPEVLGILESNKANTITYYGYAGDGG